METADTVIVGAGIIGLCSAMALSRRGPSKIVVLEKGAGLGEGSTGASSAVCRSRYSLDEMVALARHGVDAYRRWAEYVGIADPVGRLHTDGVLWLGDLGQTTGREVARLRRLGVAAESIDDRDLNRRFPAINPCPIPPDLVTGDPHACQAGGAHLFEADGGHFDPSAALQDLLAAVRARGVDVRFGVKAEQLKVHGHRVEGVVTARGDPIPCGAVLNAGGPWCADLLDQFNLGARWPLQPTRIQIALVDRPSSVVGPLPVCADLAAGIYFRGESGGRKIVVGSILPEDEQEIAPDPDNYDKSADDAFIQTKLHALKHRLRGLETMRGVRGYSGLYTMNRADFHPIVGSTPIEGFYVANGFSGHGFKLAPAIGDLVAQAITGVRLPGETSVGLDFLSFDRTPLPPTLGGVLA